MPSLISRYIPYILLVLATLLAYANAYGGAFVLDDEFLIQRNRFLLDWKYLPDIFLTSSTQGSGGLDSFYRPMQGFLYLLISKLLTPAPAIFHALNILLHAANALLVFRLGEKLGFSRWIAFMASLVWVLHPIHTEAVTYISATADPLYTLFCLLALNTVLPGFNRTNMLKACGFFVLALLSKETALVLPLLAMACLFLTHEKPFDWKSYRATWPLWLVAGIYVLLRVTILKFDGLDFYKQSNILTENIFFRITTFLATLPSYGGVLAWPAGLHMERQFPVFAGFFYLPVILGALILLAGTISLFMAYKGRSRLPAFAFLWFIAAHLLHMGVLLPVNSLFLEHWMYLPSIGLSFALTAFIADLIARIPQQELRIVVLCPLLAIPVLLGFATFEQNRTWATPIAFYENILKYEEGTARLHNNLAMAYNDNGDKKGAMEHYRKAIATDDNYAQTRYNLARSILEQNQRPEDFKEAIGHLERALEINPDDFRSCRLLADIYTHLGDKKQAELYNARFERLRQKYLPN